jgi:hypothetical protein
MKTSVRSPRDGRPGRSIAIIRTLCSLACLSPMFRGAAEAAADKTGSAFFPTEARTRMRENAGRTAWGDTVRRAVVEAAKPWLAMSDEALWELMFGPTITRSWMVWTNGHCPACRKPVPMYSWKADALKAPWKMECPHCAERFPKNDFHAFYRSGLDAHGVFDPGKSDRRLLFNAEHPRQDDPLRSFGVDDGNGYVEGENRWRFIGAYLVYGQWKQAVLDGIVRLGQAHLLTGDAVYARKAAILLDRVADLYPGFDFKTQAVMYEGPAAAGYVSTWHDACEETRLMALAYDQVRDAIGGDPALQAFLAGQARKYKLENGQRTAAGIKRNIETRILEDAIANRWKIRSNYPRTETALVIIKTVLGWPENRAEVLGMIDELVGTATAVDGVTGEKGLANYAASTVANLAYVLALYDRLDPRFLGEILARHPALRMTYRFHYDTWFRGLYYPAVGDSGGFGRRRTVYAGATFLKKTASGAAIYHPEVDPSMFTFFMRLFEMTGDPAYVRILYRENGGTVDGLPFDLLGPDPGQFQRRVSEVIAGEGSGIRSPGFNKEQWHLAMLRSGDGDQERAVWIDYDTGGGHGHADGMNIGLFARGLDLMPDLGYPPVQYAGGWASTKARYYRRTAAHNTVVIDGRDQRLTPKETIGARTTLWGAGEVLKAIRVSGPEVAEVLQYERTLALVDVSEADSYVLDLFRVAGGKDHARFMHASLGTLSPTGLVLGDLSDCGFDAEMRAFRGESEARPGWSADWKIEDRFEYEPPRSDLHLRLTDLTAGAEAAVAEGWISLSDGYDSFEDAWIPRVMVRRRGSAEPLASAFVGLIEPYEGRPLIGSARRLPLTNVAGKIFPDGFVALEVRLADGRRDLFVSVDAENPLGLGPSRGVDKSVEQKELGLRTDAEFCFARLGPDGRVVRLALGRGSFLEVGELRVASDKETAFIELALDGPRPRLASGAAEGSPSVTLRGKTIPMDVQRKNDR